MGTRQFETLLFVFFLIIVIGGFAAIAQNDYGVTLIAVGCFGLAAILLLRIHNVVTTLKPQLPKNLLMQEYVALAAMMVLFGLRALRIRFEYVEWLFVLVTLAVAISYIRYIRILWEKYRSDRVLSLGMMMLYSSIVLFCVSLSLNFYSFDISLILGVISFVLALGFLTWHYRKGREVIFEEREVSLFGEAFQFFNLSPVILTIVLIMSAYMGLYQMNVLPALYTGEVPVRYEQLLNSGLSQEGGVEEGRAQHEVYWSEYQKFLQSMKEREQNQ